MALGFLKRQWLLTGYLCLAVVCAAPAQPAGRELTPRPSGAVQLAPRPVFRNVVVIVIDDVGWDLLQSTCTPQIDELAAGGVTFANFWTAPMCSATRAQLMTGLYGYRSGIGRLVDHEDDVVLDPGLAQLPQALPRSYAAAAIGKWHLGGAAVFHPLACGWDWFSGSTGNLNFEDNCVDYQDWLCNTNGQLQHVQSYATTYTTDEAITLASTLRPPWLLYVSYNAPHGPFHTPFPHLTPCRPSSSTIPEQARAMLEACDTEIGRLLDALRPQDAVVVLLSDNGTFGPAVLPPFDPNRSKGTVYQGGINTPLIVAGPGIRRGAVDNQTLVCAVDILPTVCEIIGADPPPGIDGVSVLAALTGPAAGPRAFAYSEIFRPNFAPGEPFGPDVHRRAVRNRDWKLIRQTYANGGWDELYRIASDPLELTDRFPPDGAAEVANYNALVAELQRLGVD